MMNTDGLIFAAVLLFAVGIFIGGGIIGLVWLIS